MTTPRQRRDGRLLPTTGTCHSCGRPVPGERRFCGRCAATRPRTRKPASCGTYAAYQAHVKAGDKPCAPCRKASAEYGRQRRKDKAKREEEQRRNDARRRALSRLQAAHPALYRALYNEELTR